MECLSWTVIQEEAYIATVNIDKRNLTQLNDLFCLCQIFSTDLFAKGNFVCIENSESHLRGKKK